MNSSRYITPRLGTWLNISTVKYTFQCTNVVRLKGGVKNGGKWVQCPNRVGGPKKQTKISQYQFENFENHV